MKPNSNLLKKFLTRFDNKNLSPENELASKSSENLKYDDKNDPLLISANSSLTSQISDSNRENSLHETHSTLDNSQHETN